MSKVNFVELFKNNLGTVVGLISSAGVIIAGYISFTSTFVLAADYERDQKAQTIAVQQLRKESQVQFEQGQINSIDDKIFYLEQKSTPTEQDRAMLKRYQRQRDDSNQRLQNILKQP